MYIIKTLNKSFIHTWYEIQQSTRFFTYSHQLYLQSHISTQFVLTSCTKSHVFHMRFCYAIRKRRHTWQFTMIQPENMSQFMDALLVHKIWVVLKTVQGHHAALASKNPVSNLDLPMGYAKNKVQSAVVGVIFEKIKAEILRRLLTSKFDDFSGFILSSRFIEGR